MITDEVLKYWEKRINEVSNPILKARYYGLIIDFKRNCNGNIRTIHIQSIIDIIEGNFPKYSINGINKLQRAMKLAILSKKTEIVANVKKIIPEYEYKVAKDYDAGIWGRIFLLMLDNIEEFTQEEKDEYVSRLEQRLNNLTNKGRPISKIGNIEYDLDGNLALHISKTLNFSAVFLRATIQENINKKIFQKKI